VPDLRTRIGTPVPEFGPYLYESVWVLPVFRIPISPCVSTCSVEHGEPESTESGSASGYRTIHFKAMTYRCPRARGSHQLPDRTPDRLHPDFRRGRSHA
jgi:hypothetical protein